MRDLSLYRNKIFKWLKIYQIVNTIKNKKRKGEKVKLGLALSGGGIRGIAHAGVLKALEDNHIKIDAIGGTSSGALIAGLYVLGYTPDDIYMLFKKHSKQIVGTGLNQMIYQVRNIFNKESSGLRNGEKIEDIFNTLAKAKGVYKISQVDKIPISIPAVDIKNGREYIFKKKKKKKKNFYLK